MFIECLRDNLLNQFVSELTRYREGQTSNTLDLFIVDKSEIVKKMMYSSNLGANDHICLIADRSCNPCVTKLDAVKRNFHKGDYDLVRADLNSVDWELMNVLNVEDSWDFFVSQISSTVERNIPIKRIGTHKKQKWMNAECLSNVKRKHRAWRTYFESKGLSQVLQSKK